jgi:uncharacterized protein (DUF983 family)
MNVCAECGHGKDFRLARDGHRYCTSCARNGHRCHAHETGNFAGQLTLKNFGLVVA